MRNSRPRILYLVSTWPHERSFGNQLRVLQVGRALQNVGELNLVVASSNNDPDAIEKTASEFHLYCNVAVKSLPLRGLWQRLRWGLDPYFLNLNGWVGEERATLRVRESLGQFDLIWLSGLRVANLCELWRWPRSMLDIDDVPSTYERSKWRNDHRREDRLKAGVRALAWRRREKLLPKRFTLLGVCSEADRQYLGGGSRIHVIPNGFERPTVEPRPQPSKTPRLGFIGFFSYPPNLEGIRWFMRECWPRIKREIPDVRLRLVGKNSDSPLKPADPGVDGLGWMADPAEEIATWSAMIVPVRQGGGTRIKVAEAFSRKCPLVSTRIGAFGYDVSHRNELLFGDTPEEFAGACIELIQKPEPAAAMAERAWRLFLDRWTWEAIAPRVWAAAEDCLRLNADRVGAVGDSEPRAR
jgi:glycosyltransferase involved in cell wall biosynthesis